jgi:hypothetical protein
MTEMDKETETKVEEFHKDLEAVIGVSDLPLHYIIHGLILHGVTMALDGATSELAGMKLVHVLIQDSINFYEKYYS